KRVGSFLYGYGDDTRLVEVVSRLLIEKKLTLTAAESLTGGAFQSMLTSVAGASDYFEGGLVTYSKRLKKETLGISQEVIDTYGVVSCQCAIEMARGVKENFGTDIGISFTGVAGPSKLEGQQPGTVWIGLAPKDRARYAS